MKILQFAELLQWVPFSQNTPEDDVWTCTPGQYTMNGFGAEDDIDWLISNFSIDFTGLTESKHCCYNE